MTVFRAYEELTWPEVSLLPRNIPIVFPLGAGYPLNLLADALGNPEQAIMLPSLPYGWNRSGLFTSEGYLSAYITNIIVSLRDDGFSNTIILSPQGLNTRFQTPWISLPQVGGRQSDFFLADHDRDKVILIPVGHTEQHGLHLPLSTDTLIIDAIARGTAASIPDLAATLPVMPFGVSTHRESFAGTLNAGGRAFEDFWLDVIDILVARGFNRFYFLNGHGGNSSFINNVIKYAGEKHRRIFCATSWLYLSGPEGVSALEKYRQSGTGGMGHACELETSLMLHINPALVHMDRAVDEIDFITTSSYYMDWVEGGALSANPPWDDDTKTGAYGAGSLGTAEKGKIWLDAAIAEKSAHVREIHEQHRLREERRNSGFGLWGKQSMAG